MFNSNNIKEIRIYANDFSEFITSISWNEKSEGSDKRDKKHIYYIGGIIEVIGCVNGKNECIASFSGTDTAFLCGVPYSRQDKNQFIELSFSQKDFLGDIEESISILDLKKKVGAEEIPLNIVRVESNDDKKIKLQDKLDKIVKFRNDIIEWIKIIFDKLECNISKDEKGYYLKFSDDEEGIKDRIRVITSIAAKNRDSMFEYKAHIISRGDSKKGDKLFKSYFAGKSEDSIDIENLSVEPEIYMSNIVGTFSCICGLELGKKKKSAKEIEKVKLSVQILSRFDDCKRPFFLQSMLIKSVKPEDLEGFESMPSSDNSLFNFLYVTLFFKQLVKAYQNGPYRTYVRFEKNDSNLKGVIDVPRHIRLNAGMNNGRVAYSYREMTADNYINHLILYAYDYAKRLYPEILDNIFHSDKECHYEKIIKEIRSFADTYGNIPVNKIIHLSDKVIGHPYYSDYEQLRKTCINFLQYMGLSMFGGDNEDDKVQGILFYVPDLWEKYLERGFANKSTLSAEPQLEVKVYSDKEEIISCAEEESNQPAEGKHETFPDFVYFENVEKPYAILDAKYKEKWGIDYSLIEDDQPSEEFNDETIKEAKYKTRKFDLNDYTQCIRDMNSLNVHITGVINPQKLGLVFFDAEKRDIDIEKTKNKICGLYNKLDFKHMISKYNNTDAFYVIPVFVPKSEGLSFAEWESLMEYSYNTAMDKIEKIVTKPRKSE